MTYTALAQSKACIRSVLDGGGEFDLILTANGNNEAAAYFTELAERYSNIRVVVNAENLGFIEPNRVALSMTETPLFVMLNDDCIVAPWWLDKLAEPFVKYPKAALSGPSTGCSQLDDAFHGSVGSRFEYLEGAILMGRTEVLKKHGLFSPELAFAYAEDSDLSLRMREAGYTLHRVDVKFSHTRAATSRNVPQVSKFQELNHTYCRKRWAHYLNPNVRKMDYPIIVRRNHAWGDTLLITPIIRALHEQKPCSPIWVETSCGAVLDGNPHIARIAPVINAPHDALVIDLNMSYENLPATHIVDAYAQKAGLSVYKKSTEVFFPELKKQNEFGTDGFVAIHVGPTSWKSKNWDVARWRELIAKLGMKTVLIGHHTDQQFDVTADLRGRTTIPQMAAVLAGCEFLITVDSLPLHIAQAVGTPVIGLFGVTDPKFILTEGSPAIGVHGAGPTFGLRHRQSGQVAVDDGGIAMNDITVDMVMDAIGRIAIPAMAYSQRPL